MNWQNPEIYNNKVHKHHEILKPFFYKFPEQIRCWGDIKNEKLFQTLD